ncbi:hypothetical protein [Sciscionella marina]|uniref:hypothetical protein n=1 Tax=Sciscionella marina TaxID=508770 RepID=UPI00036EB22A|nr:hypothetical protein [Sciscionella marina]
MEYRWRYEDSAGAEQQGPAQTFEDQQEAELWLADSWVELLDSGIEQVTLLEGEQPVYGPMSLHSPE